MNIDRVVIDIAKVAVYIKYMNTNLRTAFDPRQYMISRDYEIYYYSDTEITRVDSHTHDYYEFYFFLKGDVSIHIHDIEQHLQPGDFILIPPNTRHYPTVFSHQVPYQRFVFWISEKFCNDLMRQSKEYGYLFQHAATSHKYIYHFDVISFNNLHSKILRLLEEHNSKQFCRHAMVSLCIKDLILTLTRMVHEQETPNAVKEEYSLYHGIVNYIDSHIHEKMTLEDIATALFVSKYHIAHVFKAQMGLSIHQYILKKRLDLCRGAIASGTDITVACSQCGFEDYSSFYRAFKKEYGISPKEFQYSIREMISNDSI